VVRAADVGVNMLSKITGRFQGVQSLNSIDLRGPATILTVIVCSWAISDLLSLLFEHFIPAPYTSKLATRAQNGRMAFTSNEIIGTRNLFGVSTNGSAMALNSEPVKTALPLVLEGTVVFQDPARSLGTIQDTAESRVLPVRAGDEVESKMQILSIESKRVIFVNLQNHRKEYVALPDDDTPPITQIAAPSKKTATAKKSAQTKFKLTHTEVDAQLANYSTLIHEALAEPEYQGGAFVGFRLKEIKPGSFYEQMGLQQNDLLTTVNGEKITDVARALSLLSDLKSMNNLKIGVNRNGKDVVLDYDFE